MLATALRWSSTFSQTQIGSSRLLISSVGRLMFCTGIAWMHGQMRAQQHWSGVVDGLKRRRPADRVYNILRVPQSVYTERATFCNSVEVSEVF